MCITRLIFYGIAGQVLSRRHRENCIDRGRSDGIIESPSGTHACTLGKTVVLYIVYVSGVALLLHRLPIAIGGLCVWRNWDRLASQTVRRMRRNQGDLSGWRAHPMKTRIQA